MAIKYTIQGYLIYAAMALYLLAFASTIAQQLRQFYVFFWHKTIYVLRHRPIGALEEVLSLLNTLYNYANLYTWRTRIKNFIDTIRKIPYFQDPAWFIKLGTLLYILGFLLVVIAYIYRWIDVQHVPMQTMFEVFLSLGMIYPISIFCRKFLEVGVEAADMALGFIILFPAGFIFSADPKYLPPALQSWIFIPHVAVYMLAYIILAKAAVQAVFQLCRPLGPADPELVDYERATYRMVCLGFPLLTLGLILGSYWGKQAWGDFWGWDPKELWSLVSWLAYLLYFHYRSMFGRTKPKINSVLVLVGIATIIVTLLWANLSRLFSGMHNYAT